MPHSTKAFWLATADQAAGDSDSVKRQWEELLPAADPLLRRAIERRLSGMPAPPKPLDAAAERVLDEAARVQNHERTFGGRRSLFSRHARATQIFLLINIVLFILEMALGGSTNLDVLYRLGGLFPPAVRAGQWWRLIASAFLHFGSMHLAMNMLGLWYFGPFVEHALGFRRFAMVYLLAGIGSMATVMALSSATGVESMAVGASGCVMGLIGATGALMLRGWRREKAVVAKRRLLSMLLLVSMQVLFDSLVPQVSMSAHLSGALLGFAAVLLLRDRLGSPTPRQVSADS